ncbi:BON domain-containing protein [Paraburkholderia sacchari]|uniref:BON domain-containing protein n=2 Tax=Paraburkholderia sacchari TaxID=159450 RepID=A0A8T6ZLA9_9BURK|nr:BON domain-containing protein [Paraburkholderia sacchari]NLP65438.1 BON domain-containing protein [Paraburkholderia sacchari]
MSVAASVAALLAGGAVGVRAQGGETAGASAAVSSAAQAAPAAPAASTAREVRKANRALSRKVYAALAKHKEIDAGNISIVARDGAVTLNGTVEEQSQIDTVATVAKAVPGVKSVTNKLTVLKPLGQ